MFYDSFRGSGNLTPGLKMATLEKLVKAFEALRVFQPGNVTGEEAAK